MSIYEPALHNNNESRAALAVSLDDFFSHFPGIRFSRNNKKEKCLLERIYCRLTPRDRGVEVSVIFIGSLASRREYIFASIKWYISRLFVVKTLLLSEMAIRDSGAAERFVLIRGNGRNPSAEGLSSQETSFACPFSIRHIKVLSPTRSCTVLISRDVFQRSCQVEFVFERSSS